MKSNRKMIKYSDSFVVFEEIPDKVSLALNITNCANNCPGCHSPELALDMGQELTEDTIDRLINENAGANCFLFMGEGRDYKRLLELAMYIKDKYPYMAVGVYSGRDEVEDEYYKVFDYVKVGPYKEDLGPLNKRTTNQRLYKMVDGVKTDITERFWKNSIN